MLVLDTPKHLCLCREVEEEYDIMFYEVIFGNKGKHFLWNFPEKGVMRRGLAHSITLKNCTRQKGWMSCLVAEAGKQPDASASCFMQRNAQQNDTNQDNRVRMKGKERSRPLGTGSVDILVERIKLAYSRIVSLIFDKLHCADFIGALFLSLTSG